MQTPKTGADVETAVREFIAENYLFGAGPESISDTDSFLAQGIINSMGVLELITFLENTYDIKVGDDEVVPDNLDSVRQVAAYVRRKLGSPGNNGTGSGHAG
ncbi:MAG TPA: acyl carrier protein [Fimbriiglobus sp.]|jgi:acyl carrier protein|nr:acyl carrier protein [Fimbriiglobus sp.]